MKRRSMPCTSVQFRWQTLLIFVLAASSLAACGPRTLRSWFFPETYTVSSTIEFRMLDGSVTTQTQRYRCKIIDTTDALNGGLGVELVGDRHWLKNPDGSILIVGALQPCRWTTTPKRGLHEKEPLNVQLRAEYPSSLDTVLFDDVDQPLRATVFHTAELIKRGSVISDSPLIFTGRRPSAPRLKNAFPGLHDLVLVDGYRGGGGWDESDLRPNHFSGVVVRTFKLNDSADCGATGEGAVMEIGRESPCRDVRTNCDTADGDFVCGRYIRNLDVAYDDRLTNAQVIHSAPEIPAFMTRLFATDLIMAQAGIVKSEGAKSVWRPHICYKTYCRDGGGYQIYDRDTHEVLIVWVTEISFDPSDFTPEIRGYVEG